MFWERRMRRAGHILALAGMACALVALAGFYVYAIHEMGWWGLQILIGAPVAALVCAAIGGLPGGILIWTADWLTARRLGVPFTMVREMVDKFYR